MDYLQIKGMKPINGTIEISGAKNEKSAKSGIAVINNFINIGIS
jgi:UDP-N-acetylglucosamine enolpyruvyl transferase